MALKLMPAGSGTAPKAGDLGHGRTRVSRCLRPVNYFVCGRNPSCFSPRVCETVLTLLTGAENGPFR